MSDPHSDIALDSQADSNGLVPLTAEWLSALGERLGASAQLVMAETRLAMSTFLLMVFVVILAAGALLFGWGLLMVAAGQAMALAGVDLALAIGLLSALHLGLAWGLWRFANHLGRYLEFRHTRRLLGS